VSKGTAAILVGGSMYLAGCLALVLHLPLIFMGTLWIIWGIFSTT